MTQDPLLYRRIAQAIWKADRADSPWESISVLHAEEIAEVALRAIKDAGYVLVKR